VLLWECDGGVRWSDAKERKGTKQRTNNVLVEISGREKGAYQSGKRFSEWENTAMDGDLSAYITLFCLLLASLYYSLPGMQI